MNIRFIKDTRNKRNKRNKRNRSKLVNLFSISEDSNLPIFITIGTGTKLAALTVLVGSNRMTIVR